MIMETLLIVSQKGGCGKSTLAVHLAVCAVNRGRKTVVIDIDPQGNALDWNSSRSEEKQLDMIHAQAGQLKSIIDCARDNGADLIIIDTSPRADAEAAVAMRYADMALVPCQPSRFDLKAMDATVQMLRLYKVPFGVVLSVAGKGRLVQDTKFRLMARDIPVLDTVIHRLVAYNYALFDGSSVHEFEPGGKAAAEIDALYDELQKPVNAITVLGEVAHG
jgi:chromosome partitioning protein